MDTKENGLPAETNMSYIFFPFRCRDAQNAAALLRSLEAGNQWERVEGKVQYLLKYVADKMERNASGKRGCSHFRLSGAAMETYGLGGEENIFYTDRHMYKGTEKEFGFEIRSVQLYCFSSSVSILVFQMHFICGAGSRSGLSSEEMLELASAQYYLKKVSREHIHKRGDDDPEPVTLLHLAQRLVELSCPGCKTDFFFYANPGTERANMLTYAEAGFSADYGYELFYLRGCYERNYVYYKDEEKDRREIYHASQNITWGLSPEAAVCITCPEQGGERFLHTTFFKNFQTQYLFMYILLLHQKYVLYLFLTMINAELYEKLETLEDYRQKLYKFETDFVFSRVTEVPQYQNLYDRMLEVFALRDMYEDVREPLLSLSEMRRSELEKQQKKSDDKMNHALFVLSLLGAVSALADMFQVTEYFFGNTWSERAVGLMQGGCSLLILVIVIYVITTLFGKK